MENLLNETIETLEQHQFKWSEDVDFITGFYGSKRVEIPIAFFEEKANREYDNGYGGTVVDDSLIIIMKNGDYFDRSEYDGSEWWEYHPTHFTRPREIAPSDFTLFPWDNE